MTELFSREKYTLHYTPSTYFNITLSVSPFPRLRYIPCSNIQPGNDYTKHTYLK